jgi:hypothetical protein
MTTASLSARFAAPAVRVHSQARPSPIEPWSAETLSVQSTHAYARAHEPRLCTRPAITHCASTDSQPMRCVLSARAWQRGLPRRLCPHPTQYLCLWCGVRCATRMKCLRLLRSSRIPRHVIRGAADTRSPCCTSKHLECLSDNRSIHLSPVRGSMLDFPDRGPRRETNTDSLRWGSRSTRCLSHRSPLLCLLSSSCPHTASS